MRPHFPIKIATLAIFILSLSPTSAQVNRVEEILKLDREIWKQGALFCKNELPEDNLTGVKPECSNASACFPGEGAEPIKTPSCGDGDMTLFNGLLCIAGVPLACEAVSFAQNTTTGQWYRSPRLRNYPRLRRANTFSPDMALGVQLWALLDKSTRSHQFRWWLDWMGRNQRCAAEGCSQKIPRFCPDDDLDGDAGAEYGCTLRPGDLGTLALVSESLGTKPEDSNLHKALARWKNEAVVIAHSSAVTNRPGYSQHLSAVNVLVLWRAGIRDPLLEASARHLAKMQPQNAFFAWLNYESADSVAEKALEKCPKTINEFPAASSRRDWIWQREDTDDTNKRNMIWDCRFIAALLRNNITPKGQ